MAIALVCCVLAVTAGAQRGGHASGGGHAFGGGGHFGGAGAPIGGPTHSGSTLGNRAGFAGRPGFARPGTNARFATFSQRRQGVAGTRFSGRAAAPFGRVSATRPAFFNRPGLNHSAFRNGLGNRDGYGYHRFRFFSPVVFYPGLFDTGFFNSYFDPFWDDFDNDGPLDSTAGYADAYPNSSPIQDGAAPAPDPVGSSAAATATADAPPDPQPPAPFLVAPSASPTRKPLPQEDAVTLIFKDGRPAEQVRNYALTRTALLIPGRHMREIPLDELDLARTEQVNQAAGISFAPPR